MIHELEELRKIALSHVCRTHEKFSENELVNRLDMLHHSFHNIHQDLEKDFNLKFNTIVGMTSEDMIQMTKAILSDLRFKSVYILRDLTKIHKINFLSTDFKRVRRDLQKALSAMYYMKMISKFFEDSFDKWKFSSIRKHSHPFRERNRERVSFSDQKNRILDNFLTKSSSLNKSKSKYKSKLSSFKLDELSKKDLLKIKNKLTDDGLLIDLKHGKKSDKLCKMILKFQHSFLLYFLNTFSIAFNTPSPNSKFLLLSNSFHMFSLIYKDVFGIAGPLIYDMSSFMFKLKKLFDIKDVRIEKMDKNLIIRNQVDNFLSDFNFRTYDSLIQLQNEIPLIESEVPAYLFRLLAVAINGRSDLSLSNIDERLLDAISDSILSIIYKLIK